MAMDRFANFSDEVTEGQRSVRADDERVERSGFYLFIYFFLFIQRIYIAPLQEFYSEVLFALVYDVKIVILK